MHCLTQLIYIYIYEYIINSIITIISYNKFSDYIFKISFPVELILHYSHI